TVTNSERRISRQRTFLPPPGDARPDWWQLAEVARRMGFAEAFAFASPAEIFAEHATLSGFENDGVRDFDIGAYGDIDETGFARLEAFQWPQPAGTGRQETRFFAYGRFYYADVQAPRDAVEAELPVRTSDDLPLEPHHGRV